MLLPEDPSESTTAPLRPLRASETSAGAGRNPAPGGEGRTRARRFGAWQVAGDLPASFRYAAQGLTYGFLSQRNFRIHVFTGTAVFGTGLWLGLSADRLAVLVLELLNTATEAVVDLAIGRRFHPLARIAKDCAAAAVLVGALASLLIAALLLVPPLMQRLGH